MLTTSCLLMLPTDVSETKNFWKEAKGGNLRTTFLGVVMDHASFSGYHSTGLGGATVLPSCFTLMICGI